ncbi:MAG: tRNA (N6-isopentenyl adenosine(37)-C2)-methylthiotransferase MiaB [Clostridiales bacterium]|nr:tRNA (N6-isopentenyl adenosine(37)-C2)-methylthiotransferase MiaB [Clostridiales bacterium]
MENKYYQIITYGCQMNIHESEKLAGILEELGYKKTDKKENASVIVFNTCCIRQGAEDRAFGNIGALKGLKKKNKDLIIAVCGCMTQQKDRVEKIKSSYPFVDIVFGTHNLFMFKDLLIKRLNTNKRVYEISDDDRLMPEQTNMVRDDKFNAYVNIIYGCNNFCSYCIVPYVRGRERSRNFNEIVEEVKKLIDSDYKCITLLGQNVNSYGNDIEDSNVNFNNLLKTLANLDGDFTIKFMTSHPKDLSKEVIDTISENDKLSKEIHLPVQSGSNKILKLMNRRYTIEHYMETINYIKQKIPNVRLTTDIIVGFPGETEEDFMETYNLIKTVEYDGIFAYMYSVRTGTKAETMPDHLPLSVKNERVNKILNLEKEIQKKNGR